VVALTAVGPNRGGVVDGDVPGRESARVGSHGDTKSGYISPSKKIMSKHRNLQS
jgi:hypothetical protein